MRRKRPTGTGADRGAQVGRILQHAPAGRRAWDELPEWAKFNSLRHWVDWDGVSRADRARLIGGQVDAYELGVLNIPVHEYHAAIDLPELIEHAPELQAAERTRWRREQAGYALESATWERAQQRREGSAAEGTARPPEHGEYQVWHITDYARALLNWFRDAGDSVFPEAYTRVATVEADSLDQVFALTNHGEKPWQENPGVVGTDARSTSVGDVIVDPRGRPYRVENTGFREMPSRNESPLDRIERNLREMKQEPEISLESTWHYVEPIPGDVDSIYDTCDTLGPWHTLNPSERLLALKELSWEGVSPEDKQRIINRETVDFTQVSTAGRPPSSSGELAEGPDKEEPGKGTYQVWHDTFWPNSRIAHVIGGPGPRFPTTSPTSPTSRQRASTRRSGLTEHGDILSGDGRNWKKNPDVRALVEIPRSTAAGDVIVDPQGKAISLPWCWIRGDLVGTERPGILRRKARDDSRGPKPAQPRQEARTIAAWIMAAVTTNSASPAP